MVMRDSRFPRSAFATLSSVLIGAMGVLGADLLWSDTLAGPQTALDAEVNVSVAGVYGAALVSVPALSYVGPGMNVAVPIAIDPAGGVVGIEITLTYDSSVLTPTGVYVTGYTEGMTVVPNLGTPGTASFAMFGPPALAGSGQVAWVEFHGQGSAGSISPLVISAHVLNEGSIASVAGNGVVDVVARDVAFSVPDGANGAPGRSVNIPITVNPAGSLSTFNTTLQFNPAIGASGGLT